MLTPGQKLRELRLAAKLSAQELAELSGVPKDTIIAWETKEGRLNPNKTYHVDGIQKIAAVLKCSPQEIWGLATGQVRESRPVYSGDVSADVSKFLLDLTIQYEGAVPDEVLDRATELLTRILANRTKTA